MINYTPIAKLKFAVFVPMDLVWQMSLLQGDVGDVSITRVTFVPVRGHMDNKETN